MASSKTQPGHPRAGLPPPNSSASFWHSEPNAYLLGRRSTPTLPQHADIVIVGSGITGASIARYLCEDPRLASLSSSSSSSSSSPSILLLEAREICWGATGRNGGHCQPLLFDSTPEIAAFEIANVEAVKSYINSHDVDCEWRSVVGCRAFWDETVFAEAKDAVERLRKADPALGTKVQIVDAKDKDSKEIFRQHRVKDSAVGVMLSEGAGQLWPYKYVSAIIERLEREGKVNVQTHTPVIGVESADTGTTEDKAGRESREPNGYNQRVYTSRGDVLARNVILATNGYTSHLLRDFADLIVPTRCEMSALHPPKGSERLPNSYGMVGYANFRVDHDYYLIQRPFYSSISNQQKEGEGVEEGRDATAGRTGGHLMFGGGRGAARYNCVGEYEDDIVDPGEADNLRRVLLKMLDLGGEDDGSQQQQKKSNEGEGGEGEELKASHQWTGIKGYSRDRTPWVGRVPKVGSKLIASTAPDANTAADENKDDDAGPVWEPGLWLCAGYTGHGMPNATLCSRAVVEMVLASVAASVEKNSSRDGDIDDDGTRGYRKICERLVKTQQLPLSYIITTDRVVAAREEWATVAEQDAGGVKSSRSQKKAGQDQGKGKDESRCQVM